MKRWMAVILALILVCVFVGCGKNAAGHAEGMVGNKSSVVLSDQLDMQLAGTNQVGTLAFYRIYNPTESTYTYGAEYMIEVLLDGVWYTTAYGPRDVTAEGRSVQPGAMADYAFELQNTLPEGTYRYIDSLGNHGVGGIKVSKNSIILDMNSHHSGDTNNGWCVNSSTGKYI